MEKATSYRKPWKAAINAEIDNVIRIIQGAIAEYETFVWLRVTSLENRVENSADFAQIY